MLSGTGPPLLAFIEKFGRTTTGVTYQHTEQDLLPDKPFTQADAPPLTPQQIKDTFEIGSEWEIGGNHAIITDRKQGVIEYLEIVRTPDASN